MDALRKLLEQAQALQEAALQAELEKLRGTARPAGRPDRQPGRPRGQDWSGEAGHSIWVDPASQPVPVTPAVEALPTAPVPLGQRLRDPETLRTFFLLSQALGPPPGLAEEDDEQDL